ncbi:MAG: HlyD family type I secretion periplasmic adaptor subunit [Rhodovulum sulfidophilum]|uniref:Membrane fusion protein (MFP) family protein n=1 Tax=Rhodovulum sulfidophilum TaxID=35806 RepID=A0A2W5N8C8_RHOSU|nr:MAG: HlyD family type I secretion periplasmic adaptor subunit [Rhodovulum sulfidophilum]
MSTSHEPVPRGPIQRRALSPREAIREPRRAGLVVIACFVAGFGAWATLAPLSGGAVAPGRIAPDGSVRTVQHLEGGIVDEILVRDGEFVPRGAPLIALRKVASQADVATLLDRRRARLAETARLEAELGGRATLAFPATLGPEAADVMAAETRIFRARKDMRSARERVLRRRIDQLSEQIRGFEAQVASAASQLDLVRQEIADKTILLEQRLAPKAEVSRLRRAAAEIEGFRGQHVAAIAEARQRIGETEIELVALDADWLQSLSQRAGEVRGELAEIDQQLAALRDVLDRTLITAPIAGVVNDLRVSTIGGVIVPGEDLLDLVPTEENLVIDVRISPLDIDIVQVGLPALVHLTALSGRSTPRLYGRVTVVSADLVFDETTRSTYYDARVEVSPDEAREFKAMPLSIGMPAEVIIVSQERTALEYLMKPFFDAMVRAGREA